MNKKLVISGIIATIIFLALSFSLQHSEAIWIQTRIFGLLSFLTLFLTVALGEIRLLHKVKGDFALFRFHKPIAIFASYLILLHFISAAFDKFKWGVYLNFSQYLGFSFSDKWLVLLSLGTLSFYLILIVGFTSANKSMQILGYKKWKIIHFLSYIAFVIAYIHSINLGTDLKTSVLAPILHPLVLGMFLAVTALFIVRSLNGTSLFEDQKEITLATIFFLIVIIGGVFTASILLDRQEKIDELSSQLSSFQTTIDAGQTIIDNNAAEIELLNQELWRIKNGEIG